jgi:SAM-dependent methyltransferase
LLGALPVDGSSSAPLGGLNPNHASFAAVGTQFYHLLVSHLQYHPGQRLLDLGCGTGRLIAACRHLLPAANYVGADVNARFVAHCQARYGYQFDHLPFQHPEYSPDTGDNMANYQLPYHDGSFDCVAVIATFNHNHFNWSAAMLREIARVLTGRGVALCTALLIGQHNHQWCARRDRHPFKFTAAGVAEYVEYGSRPLFNVAFAEKAWRRACLDAGLHLVDPIGYGQWCKRPGPTGHDLMVLRKARQR